MQQFVYSLASLWFLVVTAWAAPRPGGPSPALQPAHSQSEYPEECVKAGLYICPDVNWGGECVKHETCVGSGPDQCYELDGTASSIGPDQGFHCLFYRIGGCRDLASQGVLELAYPGVGDLRETAQGDWNDKIYSYQCFADS